MNLRHKTDPGSVGLNLETLMETLFYRDEFLSIASHELRTPLTSLKLQAQVFKRQSKKEIGGVYSKEKVDRLVEQIEHQTSHLMRLVEDMLDITRIRSGQFIMTKKIFNLSDLLSEVISDFSVDVKIERNIFICGDRDRILQVFRKLLNNAARYGKGLPIKVKLVKKKSKISFVVTDQGEGISEEDQERIFHRFQRAIAATEVSGLGLGLYLAREIVEAHGGKIAVKSKMGQGATFTVDFIREE